MAKFMPEDQQIPAAITLSACPVCKGADHRPVSRPLFGIGQDIFSSFWNELGLVRCRSCSLVFVNPRPNQAALNQFYSSKSYICHNHTYGAEARFLTQHAQIINALLCRQISSPQPELLDYGCGGGYLLHYLSKLGWSVYGYDIGQRALDTSRSHGLKVTNSREELLQRTYDAVTLCHSFEHVSDPEELLGFLKRLIKPGGVLLIEVPNALSLRAILSCPFFVRHAHFDERYRAFPIHLFHYMPKTLQRALIVNGYKPVKVTTTSIGLPHLLREVDEDATSEKPAEEAPTSIIAKSAIWKRIIKSALFNSLLGDSLIIISKPANHAL